MDARKQNEYSVLLGLAVICAANNENRHSYNTDDDPPELSKYWIGDVVGVFWSDPVDIQRDLANADAAPLTPLVPNPVPYHGYYFISIKHDNSRNPSKDYGQVKDTSGRRVLSLSQFAFCAYPVKYNWGYKLTFIINQDSEIYAVDNGGKPVTVWPTDKELAERYHIPFE